MKIPIFFSREREETQAVDLHISGYWAVWALVLSATLLMVFTLLSPISLLQLDNWQNLALLGFALASLCVLIYLWRPNLGIICALASLVVCIFSGLLGLNLFNSLILLVVPVVLAAILRSLRVALAFAGLETLLSLFFYKIGFMQSSDVLSALALIWFTFILLYAIYLPVYQAVNWYRLNYNMTQTELEKLRSEREERGQVIEELDNANRQLAALYEKNISLRQIAEDSEKSKAIFVAKVSHEFRTPLSMIIGLSGLALGDQQIYGSKLPAELVEDMTIINRNCEHLAKLVNDVLDLTRSEAGQLTIHRDWTDIPPEIEEVISEISPLIEKKKIKLTLDLPQELPRVYCDRLRIRQVVLNLVGNAALYTERGSIQVSISTDERYITFEVADSGPGIAATDLDLIFEPFFRGRNRPPGEIGSSGLGLSICRQFVELHGGQIWVKSELGQGSIFSFKIPISPQEPHHASAARWISEEKIWQDRKSRLTLDSAPIRQKVVVYDPGGELTQLLGQYMGEIDFESTSDLEVAIQQSEYHSVAVVLVNGHTLEQTFQVVDQCRSRLFDTPVVGCIYPPYLQQLKDSGVISYLMKPIVFSELQQVIQGIPGLKKRILIVDDDRDLCKLLARMLSRMDENCETFLAYSGEEALKIIPNLNPDLILLDIVMGGMDGWEVLEAKNKSVELRQIPVIILSGQDTQVARLTSPVMLSAFGAGLNIDKLIHSALDFSALMFSTE
jgi:signal transduction histidine kinase/CheY-like chemotaxis protein